MFELNKHLVFHRNLAVDMQSIVEFLQLIHDFLTQGKMSGHLSTYFSLYLVRDASSWSDG